jgi:predicted Fe-S protein YdhL (DUF1289 family)
MSLTSPCTDICRYDPNRKWCVGCGRTVDEIKSWRKLSPFHRTALAKELTRRMKRIEQDEIARSAKL